MRLWAFDHLRLASIFVVILFHAMVGYNANVHWWYVSDSGGTVRYTTFLSVVDLFLMATMFLVSGFFTAKSLLKVRVDLPYVTARAKRLLLPGYLNLLLLCPLLFFIPTLPEFSLATLWQEYWLTWKTTISLGFEPVKAGGYGFAHHIWFVELLFLMTIAVGLSWPLWRRWLQAEQDSFITVVIKLFGLLVLAWGLTFVPVMLGFKGHDWQSYTGLLVVQPVRLGCYLAAFMMGVYFYTLHQQMSLGRIALACGVAVLASWIMFKAIGLAMYVVGLDPWANKMLTASSRVIFCFGYGLIFTFIFWLFLNRDIPWLRSVHDLNYGIYLMHLVYVVLMQQILLIVDWPVMLEVLLITAAAFALSAVSTLAYRNVQSHWSAHRG